MENAQVCNKITNNINFIKSFLSKDYAWRLNTILQTPVGEGCHDEYPFPSQTLSNLPSSSFGDMILKMENLFLTVGNRQLRIELS